MAPTETLAEQHFLTIDELCAPLGVRVTLLTSSLRAKEHAAARQLIASGDAQIVVGTHALIEKEVDFRDLAVAVVDEQHRFGVAQRTALVEGRSPHVLHLTATPIPRTLALTVYGDLDVSELALPPADRKPIVTAWVTEDRSSEAYSRLCRHLDDGRQAYVVCPLIEASETRVARAAEDEAERLRTAELRGYRVGCLHGRLRPAERRGVMASFKARELDVLVATTVIEVGVDVPNATIMIVQEADRFGLAQLHQLRGRVGRGAEQSYCLLVSRAREELSETARRAPRGDGRDDGRLRARRARSRDPRRGPAARRAPVRLLRPPLRPAAPRPGAARARARDARAARSRRRGPPRRRDVDRLARARPSTSASREDRRRLAEGPPDRGAEGRRHAPDRRSRARGGVLARSGRSTAPRVLDLFAGSGAMGLEALSRGAASCVFVERDRDAARVIQANLEKLRLTGAVVVEPRRRRRRSARSARADAATTSCSSTRRTRSGSATSRRSPSSCPPCSPTTALVVVETVGARRAGASARPRHDPALRFRADHGVLPMITAICPGSYDPVTNGHVDVIRRAAAIFDRVVVGVVRDPTHKQTLFTVEERVAFLEDALSRRATTSSSTSSPSSSSSSRASTTRRRW